MNGADRLCDTLLINGVDVCFANPGTSEMHFVAALDRKPQMRCVLGLFEGVVTGAADGYARMADKPAATLLHCGPGMANALANMHNARRAWTPMINVVGDHATYHLQHDAPLTSDIESLARPMSHFVRRIDSAEDVGPAIEEAYVASLTLPGVTTVILPADCAWNSIEPATLKPATLPALKSVDGATLREVAAGLRKHGKRAAIMLTGLALREKPMEMAARVCAATGAQIFAQMSNGRIQRGVGRVAIPKVYYPIDKALEQLKDVDYLVLVGAQVPVGFFAYPGKPGRLVHEGCEVTALARPGDDLPAAIDALADEIGAKKTAPVYIAPPRGEMPGLPTGPLDADKACAIVSTLLPENCIVADESVSSGRMFYFDCHSAPQHDYIQLTGGAIGEGIPLAIGAAVACPDRKVVAMQADGSGMYTVQGLWTQAREKLDIVTVIFANRTYQILHGEMRAVGVNDFGRNATLMLNLDEPALDWVQMARGMGVEAARATTAEEFADLFRAALARKGPFLIEAVI
ncbi:MULTISPECIES: acetolactate synthase large subunit [unclassified Bosea (in: a-proteobacteria)]|uniref:acetolactate synthase large subunit n=1 Tax=unclassified Bosea (in: a-proteobacteria) TaxID=2653178 RepID=UPI00095614D7|nr:MULTISPECIES: acetolactate synthase large subunit [unclassified Bosea (in: a-proteobacteria)]TAJ27799.1 MAG: acetolactate synthase large subunit [Bosea sp. (in: a-proteobacteria)]SIQ09522.1 acetolactate synthase-1/2/3 large subunit [Bosea sp. TND4EK4]